MTLPKEQYVEYYMEQTCKSTGCIMVFVLA
jgi:hypothetical protein